MGRVLMPGDETLRRSAFQLVGFTSLLVTLNPTAIGQSNISSSNKYAWGENIGWTNWRDADAANQGVRVEVSSGYVFGYIWCENVGWINTGNGGGPYANMDNATYGINIGVDGYLNGFAWGENIGWVNFGTESLIGTQGARYDSSAARFTGFAWGENVGWINLDDAEKFVGVESCPSDLSGDGMVDAGDLAILLAAWGTPNADLDGDGTVDSGDLAVLLAAWGPCL